MYLSGSLSLVSASETGPSLKEDAFSVMAREQVAAFLGKSEADHQLDYIIICNCFGGWGFGERQLDILEETGPQRISAFQAVAWFPTAAQGQITINLGLRVPATTFAGEGRAFFDALLFARALFRRRSASSILVCAVECYGSRILRSGLNLKSSKSAAVSLLLEECGRRRIEVVQAAAPRGRKPDYAYPLEVDGLSTFGATALPMALLKHQNDHGAIVTVGSKFELRIDKAAVCLTSFSLEVT